MKTVLLIIYIYLSFFKIDPCLAGGCASRDLTADEEFQISYSFSFGKHFVFSNGFDPKQDEMIPEEDQRIIENSCNQIASAPLGNVLLQSICHLLEEKEKQLSFFPDERTCFDHAKTRKCSEKIFVGIANTNKSHVMQIDESGENGDTTQIDQPFVNILRHELIHAYHFLEDEQAYKKNVRQTESDQWVIEMNRWLWPSLADVSDSLKIPNLWSNRMEEVLTVLGSEEESISQEEYKEGNNKKIFSEIAFTCKTKKARAPYDTEKYSSFHKESRKIFFKSANMHRKKLLQKARY